MTKKLISVILAIVLAVLQVPLGVFADEAPASVFEFSELGNEYSLLKELDIADESQPAAKIVSRGEFAMLVSKSLGIFNPQGLGAAYRFADVTSANPYAGYISALMDMGIMNGAAGGMFRPDDRITLDEAACVAVRMINAHKALGIGSAMTDYVSCAARHGILGGISTSDYARTAHRAEVYMILYNTLMTPVYIDTSYTDEPSYTLDKDITILTEYWHIKKARGLVYADNHSAICGNRTQKADSLNILGKVFLSQTATTNDVVGREIEFYYVDNDKEPVIRFAYIPDSVSVELTPEMIISFDYLNGVYTAEIDGKEKSFRIGDSYYLSYNGDAIDGSNPAYMNPSSGSVTLIDNGDGVYNVVIVNHYQNIVVDYYDPYTNTIVDILDASRNICIDDYTDVTGIEDYNKLQRYNIITAIKSPSGEKLRLYLTKTAVTGTLSGYSTTNGTRITIDDRIFAVRGDVRFEHTAMEAGNSYTVYTDYYGNAVYVTEGGRQSAIMLTYSGGLSLADRQCLVLTKSGERKAFTLASSVEIRTPGGVQRVGAGSLESYVPPHTTMLYDTNSQEQINEIILPMIINTEDEYKSLPDYPLFRVDYFLKNWPTGVSAAYQYREEINGFANWLILDTATVMQIPCTPGGSYDDENTLAYGIAEFQNYYEVVVNPNPTSVKSEGEIEVYQTSGDFCAPSILVIHGGNSNTDVPLDTDSTPYIITSITQGYDEANDKSATRLEILGTGGKTISAFVTDEAILSRDYLAGQSFGGSATLHSAKTSLAVGDIVQISRRADDGRIGRIALLYDSENNKLTYADLLGYNKIFRMYAGEAVLSHGSYFEYTNLSTMGLERTNLKSATVIVCQKDARGKISTKTGTRADIMPGDRVVIYARYINNRLVFVYKD